MEEKKNLCKGSESSLAESAGVAMQITLQEFRTTTILDRMTVHERRKRIFLSHIMERQNKKMCQMEQCQFEKIIAKTFLHSHDKVFLTI